MARLRDGLDLFSKIFCSGAVLVLIEINASSEFEVTNVVGDPDEFEIELAYDLSKS